MLQTLDSQLPGFIRHIQSLSVTQLRKLDGILSDLANHIHDIWEYVDGLQENTDSMTAVQKKKQLAELALLKEQLDQVAEVLCDMEYDSHYMDRAQHILGTVYEDVEGLMEELGKG